MRKSVFEPFSPQPPVTQAVETVEKVIFQKLSFEKWEKNVEKHLVFGVPHNILAAFWHFLSPLWEIFMNISRTRVFRQSRWAKRHSPRLNCLAVALEAFPLSATVVLGSKLPLARNWIPKKLLTLYWFPVPP
jgi:hypothetical protein